MKQLIKDIIIGIPVDIGKLREFIMEYSSLCGLKETRPAYIDVAIQLISNGNFDINYACRRYAEIKKWQIVEIKDKNGVLISVEINEKNEKL